MEMGEWQAFKLHELGILQRGRSRHRPRYAFHLYGGKYPFIQTGEIREAKKYVRNFARHIMKWDWSRVSFGLKIHFV